MKPFEDTIFSTSWLLHTLKVVMWDNTVSKRLKCLILLNLKPSGVQPFVYISSTVCIHTHRQWRWLQAKNGNFIDSNLDLSMYFSHPAVLYLFIQYPWKEPRIKAAASSFHSNSETEIHCRRGRNSNISTFNSQSRPECNAPEGLLDF